MESSINEGDRNAFIRDVFAGFESRAIKFCVSRNASETFAETDSDLDLTVARRDWKRAEEACRISAERNGLKLILRTHFANLCLLFWSPGNLFVRIDIEPGLRWRIFPIVDADALLSDLREEAGIQVPCPRGEALVIVCKAAWTGGLTERYRSRIKELERLSDGFARLSNDDDTGELVALALERPRALRKRLVVRLASRRELWLPMVQAVIDDLFRFLRRFLSPPGIHIQCDEPGLVDPQEVSDLLRLAFPSSKSVLPSPGGSNLIGMLSALFRGGMVWEERDSPKSAFYARRSNRFRIERSDDGIRFVHANLRTSVYSGDISPCAPRALVDFIGEMLSVNFRSP